MKSIIRYLEDKPYTLHLLAVFLIFPALFINLGKMPLLFDGAFRGLIAYEMYLSGDYLTPTINGELYFNKPPLYNWLLLLLFKITGNFSEFIIRLPTITSFILYGLCIYLILYRDIGREKAFLNAIFFLTGGCMFFGLSSVGHIDFTLGWLVYMAVINIYYQYKRKRLFLLFSISYFLTALGFLIKGMPALIFLGIGLLVFFIYNNDWKRLFSWQHFTGILIFIFVAGLYYLFYFLHNPGYLDKVFSTLIREVVIKSSMDTSFSRFTGHLLFFPVYVLYNLLPWSLFILYLFRKNTKHIILSDPLLKFSAFIFFFNILIFWLSTGTQMKYLIPIFPFFFYVVIEFYYRFNEDTLLKKIIHITFFISSLLFVAGSVAAPFLSVTSVISGILWKSLGLAVILVFFIFIYWKSAKLKLAVFVLILIIARIGFNFIMQPVYAESLREVKFKEDAIEVGQMTRGDNLLLCTTINEDVSFYIAREREQILQRYWGNDYKSNDYYIFDGRQVKYFEDLKLPFKIHFEFGCEYHEDDGLFLVKFPEKKSIEAN